MHLCFKDALILQAAVGMAAVAHIPTQHTGLPAACWAESFKYMRKALSYIKMKLTEVYLREINSSSGTSSLASVWSIHLL